MFDSKNTYWAGKGKYRDFIENLAEKMPGHGYTSNVYVNIYLVMAHLYYDVYNNGGGNIEDCFAKDFQNRVKPYLDNEVSLQPFINEDFAKMEEMVNVAFEFIIDKDLDFPIYRKWCNHDERVISDVKPVGEWSQKGYWFNATFGEPEGFREFCRGYKDITDEIIKAQSEQFVGAVALEYKGIVFDEWTVDSETGGVWGEMCEYCAEKYKEVLSDELSEGGVGACSVKGCDVVGDLCDTKTHYYVDFKPELIKPIFTKQLSELDDVIRSCEIASKKGESRSVEKNITDKERA